LYSLISSAPCDGTIANVHCKYQDIISDLCTENDRVCLCDAKTEISLSEQ
jgi:hypothetical protein